ncbi:E1A-binding protein p400 isoform X1 [Paramormyrops kingsleyae]|uniref:E1A-binding protein p400 isoform X1 n=1 Tax=Paramormyrops kingsleyae TaxID=1676925 RepID=UPI003B96EF15
MHHGSGSQNVQRQLQRSKSFTGAEAEEQPAPVPPPAQPGPANLPQSPAASFAAAASPSAPQSPNYQIIMSRSPVTGQNVNITLQNVGQQITLTPLPLQSPASPGFQHFPRIDPPSSSYIPVASPLPQPVQPQSPTQHSPAVLQGVQRPGAAATTGLGVRGQSPTRFVEAGVLVRQIGLSSPSGGAAGHFLYQDGSGLAQLAPATPSQVAMASPSATGTVRERRLSQPHSHTGGTIHHLGPQSPVASGATLPTLGSPGHITTSSLPPHISSIIQGQLARPVLFEKPTQGMLAGLGPVTAGTTATSTFGLTSTVPPSSPSRSNPSEGVPNPPLTSAGVAIGSVKKQPRKLEEIAPATPEVAQLRKQCLEHHSKKMEALREVFKEYLIELFFLQHLQGNMMDYLAFKKKPCVPLFTYLRQNDLDLEDEEEEEEQSEVINDEVKVVTGKDGQTNTPVAIATQLPPNVSAAFSTQQQQFQVHQGATATGIANPVDIEAFKRQQVLAHADQAKRPRIDVGRHGIIFQHHGVTALGSPGVPLQQLMPTAQGGMPPTPQAVQMAGPNQSQQQYDPSKGPPVQNAASLHTPPPQLPGRLPPSTLPMASLPLALAQPPLAEPQAPPTAGLQPPVKVTAGGPLLAQGNPHTQLQTQLQQQMQPGLHIQIQAQPMQQLQQPPQPLLQPGQATVALVRPGTEASQPCQRLVTNALPASTAAPTPLSVPVSHTSPLTAGPGRPAASASAAQSKMAGLSPISALQAAVPGQSSSGQPTQESSQDKQAEQAKLESQVHQRISELRKEGQWTASRLPKLLETPRPKAHWDYLLQEMQWMAADFAQERRWKMAAAKKLVRTCARYHDQQKQGQEQAKREEEMHLRQIAGTIAREIEFFWSNIEQVVEIKLRCEVYEKRRKALCLQRTSSKGQIMKGTPLAAEEAGHELSCSRRKRKADASGLDEEDEESTIEEQEITEAAVDHQAELADLAKEAEMPLDILVKQYAGAYSEDFDWPQPGPQGLPSAGAEPEPHSEDEEQDEGEEMEAAPPGDPPEAVLIDSLLSMEQYRASEKSVSAGAKGPPQRDIAEVATAAEHLLPKGMARTVSPVHGTAPFLLHGTLREYQQIGVDWLASLHRRHLNGILADETGLGKTVQTVAFLAHLACYDGIWGPHLVVVRTCKLLSWEMELKRWCPGLKILLYLGGKKGRKLKRSWWSEPNSFHVCVTSYKLLLKDQGHFLRKRWSHLVLDEVQLIKNMTEKQWDTIFSLKSQQRLLLINTPLQNTLKELWTMIHFLLPGITRAYLDFPVKPGTDQNQDYCHKLVIRLHRMIQPFILRRSKRDVEKQLPKKYEHILKCRLSRRQKSLYEDVMTQPGAQEALKTGHFVSVLRVLMQLQHICNHPDLVQPRETAAAHVSPALEYRAPSMVLGVLAPDPWKTVDLSIFDLVSNECHLTRYETEEVLPRLKVSRQLIEEIHAAPPPPARPKPCKIKPMRLFQPVQYGTKPEGRTVPLASNGAQRPPASTVATPTTTSTSQPALAKGKTPITHTSTTTNATVTAAQVTGTALPTSLAAATDTASSSAAVPARRVPGQALSLPAGGAVPQLSQPSLVRPLTKLPQTTTPSLPAQRLVLTSQAQARLPSADAVKTSQMASIAGAQGRISQPETPVTLQFQGNKFTLSPSQLRQLTTGQPLQLQGTLGNILQIVSAPGQQVLRNQGSVGLQATPQPLPVPSAATPAATAAPPPASTPPMVSAAALQVPGAAAKSPVTTAFFVDQTAGAKPPLPAAAVQESSEERSRQVKERLSRLFTANERRCARAVLYGADLLGACTISQRDQQLPPPLSPIFASGPRRWRWVGRDSCLRAQRSCISATTHLQEALLSTQQQREAGQQLANRFSCVVPAVVAPPPCLYAPNPTPRFTLEQKRIHRRLQEAAAPHGLEIHRLAAARFHQFPDLQLLQMDSGKLEALAVLLHKLRSENRRVLIFTQMVRMLDILEAFLNYRHLTYVRLDESLPMQERQEQMKSFNRTRQVFCAILTNRCGSAVGHVFDADTIVFYDTDLNPSMDSRTQEWCDRIGRSKDIHIYRLESGNSIEEKLLKNGTKDLIREVAAQGTDYTLAFLTQRTIQDLFEVESGTGEKVEEFVVLHQDPSPSEAISPRVARPYIQALNSIGQDVSEELPTEQDDEPGEVQLEIQEEPSQIEELEAVLEQLTPIEKYALQYLECLHISEDEERAVMEQVGSAKKGWEVQHLQKLKAKEEELMVLEEEEDLFTYTREDAYNMEYVFDGEDGQTEIMPLWTPPTPPQDDNDIYIDSVICLMYDTVPMPESKLPPVYIRKEHKRLKMDTSAVGRKKKKGHGETVIPPRSLFDKPSMLKVRREAKEQKKNFSLKQQAPFAKPLPTLSKPAVEAGQDNPEWLISEDWALLQAVKQLLELPLNLSIMSPAHTPNWDLVSDVVNSCSRIYRSPKQCRNRYENVIIPREEGKLVYEANPKKKTKSIYKSKNSRPLRTCQIYTQDDNATHVQLYNSRFELMKLIASRRSPPIKPLLGMNPFQKNPKHASVLAESGISYDKPLPPIQVASQRAERIAKEKKAQAEQHRAQQLAQQQQQPSQPAQPPQQPGAAQAQAAVAQPQTPTAGQPAPQVVAQAQAVAGTTTVPNTAVLAGAIKAATAGTTIQTATVGGNVIVNTMSGSYQAGKRLASPIISGTMVPAGTTGPQVVHTQPRAVPAPAASAEVVTIATNSAIRAVTPVSTSPVVSTSLSPVPTPTRSLVTQVPQGPGMQLPPGKQITPTQHLQMLRQQQQQQQQLQQTAASPQMKSVTKPQQQQEMLKAQKHKLQMVQQQQQQQVTAAAVAAATQQQGQQTGQTQPSAQAAQPGTQLTTVAAPRTGAVLAGTTVVTRLARMPNTGQAAQTAQVTLTKPSMVSVPVVSSAGVTVAGISVAIGQAQKPGVTAHPFQPMQVQQLLQMKKQQAAQQKAVQPQQGQAAGQPKLAAQQVTVQASQPAQPAQQKVTYASAQLQPGIKQQFYAAPMAQAQKAGGPQQIQVAKLPQIVQQQSTVANIQQIVPAPQQIQAQPQTVSLSQPAPTPQAPVQVLSTAPQVVPQKLLQQQVVTAAATAAAASPQVQTQTPPPQSPAPQAAAGSGVADQPAQQQPKSQARGGATVRVKAPAKPNSGT